MNGLQSACTYKVSDVFLREVEMYTIKILCRNRARDGKSNLRGFWFMSGLQSILANYIRGAGIRHFRRQCPHL